MSDQFRPDPSTEQSWRELRDERGRLYARLEPARWLLEIKRNDRDPTMIFDLRQHLDLLQEIAIDLNLE